MKIIKMKEKMILCFFLFAFANLSVFAQDKASSDLEKYLPNVKVTTIEDKEYLGLAMLPNHESKEITVMNVKDKEFNTIKSESIKEVICWHKNNENNKYKLIYTSIYASTKVEKNDKGSKKKHWLLVTQENPKLNSYLSAWGYSFNESGEFVMSAFSMPTPNNTKSPDTYDLYLKKEQDKYPVLIGMDGGGGILFKNSVFRKRVMDYLSDDPELCKYIETSQSKIENISDVVKRYNPQ